MNRTRAAVLAGSWLVLLLGSGGLGACSRDEQTAHHPPTPPTQRGAPDHTYTVRGKVEMVPSKAKPTSEFLVHHEPINDFVNPNGTKGMDSMVMPFPLAKGVDLSGIATGDVVEIEFAVWTTPGVRGFEATKVRKLPADTALNFGKASGGR